MSHCAGPLFELYNLVLRAHGNTAHAGHVPSYSALYPGVSVANRFTSTLHVINSGVLKLSRLQPVTTVYRGISGMKLPSYFLEPNNQGVRGGVEFVSAQLLRFHGADALLICLSDTVSDDCCDRVLGFHEHNLI